MSTDVLWPEVPVAETEPEPVVVAEPVLEEPLDEVELLTAVNILANTPITAIVGSYR